MTKRLFVLAHMLAVGLISSMGYEALAREPARVVVSNVTPKDRQFIMRAAESDTFEIKTSRLALDKAQDPSVKQFAQRMIDDHNKTSNELKTLASDRNITISENALRPKKQARYDRLNQVSAGKDFDREYITGQIGAHREAVALYQKLESTGDSPELQRFATRILPTLRNHEQQASQVAAAIGAPEPKSKAEKRGSQPSKPSSPSSPR